MAKRKNKLSDAEEIMAEARRQHKTLAQQIEHVRWLRDVTFRHNFKAQFACATAIDKLKGLY